MQHNANPQKDRATEVEPKPMPKSAWRITFVEALPDFRLRVRFVDGLEGYVDMAQFVSGKSAGVFSSLRDENLFRQVRNELGVVSWPNGLDLAPDAMHQAIENAGCWLLS